MADEKDKQTPDTPAGEAEEVAVDAEKKDEAAPEAEEPKAEEPKAEEPEAEEPGDQPEPTPDTPAGEAEEVAEDAGAGEAEDVAGEEDDLDWKARRRLERSRQPTEAKPEQSPEELAKQRAERRKASSVERNHYRTRKRGKGEKGTGTEPAERDSVARKVRRGTVVSDKADKTITVRIDVARRHPTYEKIVRRSSTLHAHDERNEAGAGDLVQIVETRPLSRTKRWRLTEIIEKAK